MIPETVTAGLIAAVKQRNPEPIVIATGGTGYLDESFMPEQSVSWGADRFGRPFITLCLRWVDRKTGSGDCSVSTFFQRYKENPGIWAVANNVGESFPAMSGALELPDVVALVDLVLRGRARLGDYIVQLTTPTDVRAAYDWEDRPRAADDSPSAEVHSDRPEIIVTDSKSPHGRHEPLDPPLKHDIETLGRELAAVLGSEVMQVLSNDQVERLRDVLDAHDLARINEFVRRADAACLRVAQKSGSYTADLCADAIRVEFKFASRLTGSRLPVPVGDSVAAADAHVVPAVQFVEELPQTVYSGVKGYEPELTQAEIAKAKMWIDHNMSGGGSWNDAQSLAALLGRTRQKQWNLDQRPDALDKPWGVHGGPDNTWMTHEVPRAFATKAEAQEAADNYDTKDGRWGFTAQRFDGAAK